MVASSSESSSVMRTNRNGAGPRHSMISPWNSNVRTPRYILGLVKHATFVERVWFEEAVTGQSRDELGIEAGPEESFHLAADDTIESVLDAHEQACENSRAVVARLGLDDELPGNRRGALPLRWVYLHVLRELAQHCGHADIRREQILARRRDRTRR